MHTKNIANYSKQRCPYIVRYLAIYSTNVPIPYNICYTACYVFYNYVHYVCILNYTFDYTYIGNLMLTILPTAVNVIQLVPLANINITLQVRVRNHFNI